MKIICFFLGHKLFFIKPSDTIWCRRCHCIVEDK